MVSISTIRLTTERKAPWTMSSTFWPARIFSRISVAAKTVQKLPRATSCVERSARPFEFAERQVEPQGDLLEERAGAGRALAVHLEARAVAAVVEVDHLAVLGADVDHRHALAGSGRTRPCRGRRSRSSCRRPTARCRGRSRWRRCAAIWSRVDAGGGQGLVAGTLGGLRRNRRPSGARPWPTIRRLLVDQHQLGRRCADVDAAVEIDGCRHACSAVRLPSLHFRQLFHEGLDLGAGLLLGVEPQVVQVAVDDQVRLAQRAAAIAAAFRSGCSSCSGRSWRRGRGCRRPCTSRPSRSMYRSLRSSLRQMKMPL